MIRSSSFSVNLPVCICVIIREKVADARQNSNTGLEYLPHRSGRRMRAGEGIYVLTDEAGPPQDFAPARHDFGSYAGTVFFSPA